MAKSEIQGPYEHWSMVVIYDPKTGHVAHTHQVVTTRGGRHPDRKTLEVEAAEHASRARNAPVDQLAFLHVDPSEVDFDAHYIVDLKTKTLRSVQQPAVQG
jgi:hypothetical protein